MIIENLSRFEKCNLINWHNAGHKGRGIRIAVWDERPYLTSDMLEYASIPQGATANSPSHATRVAKCLHEAAPDAQIFMLSACTEDKTENVNWILRNGIDLISCSYLGAFADDTRSPYKELKASGIPFIVASGNEGYEGLPSLPSFDWTIAVGAAEYNDTRATYSNYGEKLDCLAYIPYIYLNGSLIHPNGTSFAQPFAAGMIACYMGATGKKKREDIMEFIAQNSKDIYLQGKDFISGYGIISMPKTIPVIGGDDDMVQVVKTRLLLNGKEKEVQTIQHEGFNFIKLRDLADNNIRIDYDAAKNLPIVQVQK